MKIITLITDHSLIMILAPQPKFNTLLEVELEIGFNEISKQDLPLEMDHVPDPNSAVMLKLKIQLQEILLSFLNPCGATILSSYSQLI